MAQNNNRETAAADTGRAVERDGNLANRGTALRTGAAADTGTTPATDGQPGGGGAGTRISLADAQNLNNTIVSGCQQFTRILMTHVNGPLPQSKGKGRMGIKTQQFCNGMIAIRDGHADEFGPSAATGDQIRNELQVSTILQPAVQALAALQKQLGNLANVSLDDALSHSRDIYDRGEIIGRNDPAVAQALEPFVKDRSRIGKKAAHTRKANQKAHQPPTPPTPPKTNG